MCPEANKFLLSAAKTLGKNIRSRQVEVFEEAAKNKDYGTAGTIARSLSNQDFEKDLNQASIEATKPINAVLAKYGLTEMDIDFPFEAIDIPAETLMGLAESGNTTPEPTESVNRKSDKYLPFARVRGLIALVAIDNQRNYLFTDLGDISAELLVEDLRQDPEAIADAYSYLKVERRKFVEDLKNNGADTPILKIANQKLAQLEGVTAKDAREKKLQELWSKFYQIVKDNFSDYTVEQFTNNVLGRFKKDKQTHVNKSVSKRNPNRAIDKPVEEKKETPYVKGAGWIALRAALDQNEENNFTYTEDQIISIMLKPENRQSEKYLKAARNNWLTNARYTFISTIHTLTEEHPEAKTMEELVGLAFGTQLEGIENPLKKEVYEAILVLYSTYTPQEFIKYAIRRENSN